MIKFIKRMIIFIIFILIIVFLVYLNKKEYNIKNFIYKIDNKEIHYPIFSNTKIDEYLNRYLDERIKKLDQYDIYIDYDYQYTKNNIVLTFYETAYYDKMLLNNTKSFNIDLKSSDITISNNDISYDVYNKKSINSNKKYIAFTFDDGPNHNTKKIIETLKKYDMKATFFVLGNRIEKNKEIIKLMKEYNMEIGNHTYSHRLLTNATSEDIIYEVKKTNQLIFDVINYYPKLVRPSYGSFNSKIKKSINMPIIIWNIDTLDWKYHNSKKIANSILKKVKDGDIILMHDIYSATANAVELVIPKLIEEGYEIVTVSELFQYKNIKLENGKVYGNAR